MTDGAFGRILQDPQLQPVYVALLAQLDRLGPYRVRHHKPSVQMVRTAGTGRAPDAGVFLAVAPTADGLRLTILDHPAADRDRRSDPGANEVVVHRIEDLDDDLVGRIETAYRQRPADRGV